MDLRIRSVIMLCITLVTFEVIYQAIAAGIGGSDRRQADVGSFGNSLHKAGNASCRLTGLAATGLCNLLGEKFILSKTGHDGGCEWRMINTGSGTSFTIGFDCTGIRQIAAFILIMMTAPGPFGKKTIYAAAGVVLIVALNVVRISVIACYCHDNLKDFYVVHDVITATILYASIFLIWAFWIEYVYRKERQKAKERQDEML